jgi:chromate transporter
MSETMERGTVGEVFRAFLILGLTSFGGPVAHLGYFREAFVVRRRWLTDAAYGDIVALCQFLPGPSSSQVGIALGWQRAGHAGALAAWLAFTLPSVILLLAFVYGIGIVAPPAGLLHGLKIAAFAVVAIAAWQMAMSLAPDWPRRFVAAAAAIAILAIGGNLTQIGVLAVAAVIGALFLRRPPDSNGAAPSRPSILPLVLFFALLALLPILATLTADPIAIIADRFYRAGSLVFGGGHVVLPLLEAELVEPGLIDRNAFLAGYGAAQAVPGPLFSFAAYAGALLNLPVNGLAGAVIALVAIYVPSFLLVFGTLPWWYRLRGIGRLRGALDLANAAVVGLIIATLYDPVATEAITTYWDAALALAALVMLGYLRWAPWLVVLVCAVVGAIAL